MSHVSELADRLAVVDWTGESIPFGAHSRSRVALLREYLRRAAWWADHYQAGGDWPFFDIAALVDPGVRADPSAVERVNAGLKWATSWRKFRGSVVWALHFAALLDAEVELPDLPHPFDPLVIMYERGGHFTPSKIGGYEVDLCQLPRRPLQDHLTTGPRAPLTTAELDALDAPDAGRS